MPYGMGHQPTSYANQRAEKAARSHMRATRPTKGTKHDCCACAKEPPAASGALPLTLPQRQPQHMWRITHHCIHSNLTGAGCLGEHAGGGGRRLRVHRRAERLGSSSGAWQHGAVRGAAQPLAATGQHADAPRDAGHVTQPQARHTTFESQSLRACCLNPAPSKLL